MKNSWMDEPITLRTLLRAYAWCSGIAIIAGLIQVVMYFWEWDNIKDWFSEKLKKIKQKLNK